jgi:hypothetical protein
MAMCQYDFRRVIVAVVFSLLLSEGSAYAAEQSPAPAQTTLQAQGTQPVDSVDKAARVLGSSIADVLFRMLVLFTILVIAVRVISTFWPGCKPYRPIAYGCCAILVVVLALIGFAHRYRRDVAHQSGAPLGDPTPSQQTPARDSNAPQPDQEQIRVFEAKGCQLSAPATWTVETQPSDSRANLVISDPTGEASVGIHFEPASGPTLTEKDVARLMEEANRMPLRLIDSNWSLVDNQKAWREVRTGLLRGSNRVWIRYSYQVDSAVAQVIGVAVVSRLHEAREFLETIMKSAHCQN